MFHLIARHRGVTSNTRGSVLFDIQILCSDISNMRRSASSDIQILSSDISNMRRSVLSDIEKNKK